MLEWVLRVVAVLLWGILTAVVLFVGGFFVMYGLALLLYKLVEVIGI